MSCDMIIPARSGSKGVINKNIKLLNGMPLIAHIITEANNSSSIDNVYVSTDGDDIASISEEYGAVAIKRPEDISGDTASSEAAVFHALSVLKDNNKLSKYTFFSQCTSPLTKSEDFDNAMKLMNYGNYDSIFSAKIFHGFIWKKDNNNQMHGVNHDHTSRRLMRQEMEQEYQETGAFYLFETTNFMHHKNRFFGRIGVCKIPEERTIDIDTNEDFSKAEEYLKRKR